MSLDVFLQISISSGYHRSGNTLAAPQALGPAV
jgi:hypothetical protein